MYRIFDDGIFVSHELAADFYEVVYTQETGFYLQRIRCSQENGRVYGRMDERIEKVMRSYGASARNLGVILSGAKGIGKSLFAKRISQRAVADGLPVVMVNEYYSGLPQFLSSIDQKCMVLFDEFDKNFYDASTETNNPTAVQDSFLTLFDGVYSSNKLFVITANNLEKISEFLVNRPGRFRYHLRFSYPNEQEIREFFRDQLTCASAQKEVDSVVKFSTIVPLSYDCLTAIAAELNMGEKFDECLDVMNIINVTGEHYYRGILRFENGEEVRVGWLGSRNFFDKAADATFISAEVSVFGGSAYKEIGTIVLRQGTVRRTGRYQQDGSIVLPYAAEKNFRWLPTKEKRGRRTVVSAEYEKLGQPTELVLIAEGANQPVSFKELVA